MKDLSNENVVHIIKNGVQYLQFRKLLEYNYLISHAYSLGTNLDYRTAKVNKEEIPKEEYNKSINNYKNLCDAINIDYINIVKTNQEHTDNIKIVNNKININEPDINLKEYNYTDGLITNKPNLTLSTTNADCILLIFFDPITKTIANVHSGWRGTLQRISIKTVEKMKSEFNCEPENIICCICPSIRKCHFEVKKDVKEMFEEEFKEINTNEYIYKQEDKEKWNIDTIFLNKIILKAQGLKESNIIDSGICSVCNSELIHSYRVEKQGYCLATALISLK